MDLLLQKLIELVQQTAPALWVIARRQVTTINIQDAIFVVILIPLCYLLFKVILRCKEEGYEDPEDGHWYMEGGSLFAVRLIGGIAIALMVFAVICNIVSIIMRLVNPDYYALQVLLQLVK